MDIFAFVGFFECERDVLRGENTVCKVLLMGEKKNPVLSLFCVLQQDALHKLHFLYHFYRKHT